MAEIPRIEKGWRSLFRSVAFFDALMAVVGIGGPGIAAGNYWQSGRPGFAIVLGIVALAAGAIAIGKARLTYKKERSTKSVHDLVGCLNTLHSILVKIGPTIPNAGLRLTIHVPVDNGQSLEQVAPYVGDERGGDGSAPRKFPAQSGIIGVALREKKPVSGRRTNDDYQGYVNELVNLWHYTDADARKLNPATMSYMAIPLIEEKDGVKIVRGVVYLDSTSRDFFTAPRRFLSVWGCVGVARFVQMRYNS